MNTTELIKRIKTLPEAKRALVAGFIAQLHFVPPSKKQGNHDLKIINRRAARLNREAADILDF